MGVMSDDHLPVPRNVTICFRHTVPGAAALSARLAEQTRVVGAGVWLGALPDPAHGAEAAAFADQLAVSDLLICVGGDGTVLHAAEFASAGGPPIFGVRMGRLGFLTETTEAEAVPALEIVLTGGARIEPRTMARVVNADGEEMHALNDVVIGRRTIGRSVSVGARLDGVLVAEYRGDAVVVSTATGSTGYSLSAGGPILHPTSDELVLVPVAPHLTRANALVLPAGVQIRLFVARGESAMLTVDGRHERPVETGALVEVSRSARTVRFVRLGGTNQFYANLAQRLGWLRVDHVIGDADPATVDRSPQ
jgi:NAD+ kinase